NNKQNHLNIKGITFRHFGKATVENGGGTIYHDRTLDLRSIHHLTIDSCIFEWNNDPMLVTGASSFFTVQHCRFKDQTGLWSHAQVKKSNDVYFQPLLGWVLPSTFGRSLENAAISMFANECRNYVVRNNYIDGYCNGITANFATNTINDADFYGNTITRSFDGIECDGPWRNLKVWGNDISQMLAGISMAPPVGGPNYIFRNVFHHIISRWNVVDDPYYIGCQPVNSYFSQGLGIKTNSGSTDGGALLYFINNTFHTADTLGFAAFIWDNEWGRMNWINNSFNSESEHLFYLASALNDTDFQLNSSHDHVDCPNGVLLQIKEIHGQFTCHETPLAANMEELIREVTGSERVSFRQTVQGDPKFKNPENGNFELEEGSPLIDVGLVLPGFYDYSGAAPDIGAKESAAAMSYVDSAPTNGLSIIFPNPTTNVWYIKSEEPIDSGVLLDGYGKFIRRFSMSSGGIENLGAELPVGIFFLELTTHSKKVDRFKLFKH
ncbi:MAG: hypothetical protein JNJ57_13190, partial [Saprospiraceae bacterium]|nr:hypothetical protein [Saprospiraceae bacterium]